MDGLRLVYSTVPGNPPRIPNTKVYGRLKFDVLVFYGEKTDNAIAWAWQSKAGLGASKISVNSG
jgi:hypothetical protein